MKNLDKLKVVLFLAISLIFASCNNDENNSDIPVSGSYISAKIDGVQYTVTNDNGAILGTKSGTGVNTDISILGDKTDSHTITISLSGISAPGTYAINPDTNSLLDFFDYNSEQAYDTNYCDSASGTITVTSLTSTQIEGTFSFVGKNIGNCTSPSKNVTEGRFRVIFVAL
jgi:hypothetical protein